MKEAALHKNSVWLRIVQLGWFATISTEKITTYQDLRIRQRAKMGDAIRMNSLMHGLHLSGKKDGIKQVNIDAIKLQVALHAWMHLSKNKGDATLFSLLAMAYSSLNSNYHDDDLVNV
ncbi:hypothetical protein ACFX1T_031579 [Malus domestica]